MSLTCISCKLLFSEPQLHQEHYKTDWHRYNLKRRLAELPSLTKEEFEKRAAAFTEYNIPEASKIALKCETCNKHFSSQNSMNTHMKSKKHLESIAKGPRPKKTVSEWKAPVATSQTVEDVLDEGEEEEWSDEGDENDWESCDEDEVSEKIVVDTNDCLFCDHQGDSTEANIAHMTEMHSFFIPDIEYLSDLDGLIACLAAKLQLYHACLWCDMKSKWYKSVKAVKQHMIDKGHCKMFHEGEALLQYTDFYNYPVPDDCTENDVANIDELLKNADYELVLPSGATIGHRTLSLYYKQNLKEDTPANGEKVRRVIQQYKALGYTGCTGQLAVRKAKDIMYVRRIKDRYDLKLAVKKNKLQPHFRHQVMF